MTALVAQDLSFSYGATDVVQAVSFTLAPGRVLGLLGPNGAGKTTLIKLLAGLLTPRTGDVRYGESSLASLSPRARAQYRSYVAQEERDAFPYSVADIVAMGLAHSHRFFKSPSATDAIQLALDEVGFTAPATRSFAQLSGGERQLVLVARALFAKSALVILDEPASHLDLRHKAAIAKALRKRAQNGASVVWSLHDINLAAATCDVLLLLHQGRLVALGAPHDVLEPQRLRQVYDIPLLTLTHPESRSPIVELARAAYDA